MLALGGREVAAVLLGAAAWTGLSGLRGRPPRRDAAWSAVLCGCSVRCLPQPGEHPARLHNRGLAWPARGGTDGALSRRSVGVLAGSGSCRACAGGPFASGEDQLQRARELTSPPAHPRDSAVRGRSQPRIALSLPPGA